MPKGVRADGCSRMTYRRAKEIEKAYLARLAAGSGRIRQKAQEKEALEAIIRFNKSAPEVVDETLRLLGRGHSAHRTQKRLDAFAATKTPLPRQWQQDDDDAPATGNVQVAALARAVAKAVETYMRSHR